MTVAGSVPRDPNRGKKGPQGDKGDQGDPGTEANITKESVEAVLTGEIDSHSHAATVSATDSIPYAIALS
jgi:hypothetical protein